jgi:DNA-binding Lrp family transcriptional regulator
VAEGLSNREIAQRLGLTEHTVKNYLFRIFDKLGVSKRVEVVLYAYSLGNALAPPTAVSSVKPSAKPLRPATAKVAGVPRLPSPLPAAEPLPRSR